MTRNKKEKNNKCDKQKILLSCVFAEMKNNKKDCVEQSDIDWIVGTILNKNRAEIKLIKKISKKQYKQIMKAYNKRLKGQPLSDIFGFVEFYGMKIKVNKDVLSPRMETEILVEEVLEKIKRKKNFYVLDMCTGSGAIAIALAKNSSAKIEAVDISKKALKVAKENAEKNKVNIDFLKSDLFNGLKKEKKYDIIVSNPPYIKTNEIKSLDEEVKKYDPILALDGGDDGLDFYKRIIKDSKEFLSKDGMIFFEIGECQRKDVEKLLKNEGFNEINVVNDYNNIERIIYGRRS